jgi:anti-anti-sigma factor
VTQRTDGATVIHLGGQLLAGEAAWSRSVLDAIVERSASDTVVVDCSELGYADSGGLAILFGSQRNARSLGRTWCIRGVDGQPLRALQRSGFIDLLPVDPANRVA